jgi:hypothetical protein
MLLPKILSNIGQLRYPQFSPGRECGFESKSGTQHILFDLGLALRAGHKHSSFGQFSISGPYGVKKLS